MNGFLRRTALQLLTALSQIVMLALFLVAFPRMAEDATAWVAEYFVALAIIAPIFMLFSFELRKRSAAEENEHLEGFNGKRMRGTLYAILVCVVLYFPAAQFGFLSSFQVYLAVIIFRVGTAMNDQIIANYEAKDRFAMSLYSNLAKTALFLIVALAVGYAFGPNIGIIVGSTSFAIIWLLLDRRHMVDILTWPRSQLSRIQRDDLTTGIGAFLVALTISLPRMVAALVLGEQVLALIGIGQSLNRIGQVIAGSLTQTMIAVRKKLVQATGTEARLTYATQFATFVVMIALMPLWRILFSYAADDRFGWIVGAIIFFGLLSQLNFVLQSIRLLRKGGQAYVRSPITFLAMFCVLTALLWAVGYLNVQTLIAVMLLSRAVQLWLNYRGLREVLPE